MNMAKYQKIDAIMNNIRRNVQKNTFLEDITIPSQLSNQIDIRGTLEVLNTTNDINLQTKLFIVLSASLTLNKDANFEVIIKYRTVYDRINNVLMKGLPQKAEHALNFLSTLLYVDAEDHGLTKRRTLALYAKNMTRVSGCLGTMSDMFTNSMMYHDTWNALCQCLAAACGGSPLNQSYCTHLIPICIQRCNHTNLEIFLVLQSLLPNHDRNMELFLNSNGISIFTRELLHYDKCLQLLISVAQSSAATSLLLHQQQVLNNLRYLLRLYGPNSQIGQKAMIILKHIQPRSNVTGPPINEVSKEPNKIKSNENGNNDAQLHEFDANDVLDDTATLMQKVMQEVMHFKQNKLAPLNKAASKVDVNSLIRSTSTIIINNGGEGNKRGVHIKKVSNITRKQMGQQQRDGVRCNTDAELSFSFLDNLNKGLSRNRDTKTLNRSKMFGNQKANTDKAMKTFVNAENDLPYFCRTVNNEKSIDPEGFRPIFSSTPKREEFPNPIDYPKPSIRKSSYQTRSQTTLQRTRRVVKRRPTKIPRNNDKNLRNMSLSSRFFSAINESCTTLVKTVVNIFKKNEPSHCSKDETESHTSRPEDASCSFSFLNYMQKRDAVINKLLKTKNKDCTDFSLATELCETCDTQTLKKKMARNMHLKQTVKKLKMGINLYGCDFKKISRTMWPRESYMTPLVLYNLYRKLLLK